MNSEAPVLVVIGGINGAGKSSLVGMMPKDGARSSMPRLDPDRFAVEITSVQPELTRAAANFAALRVTRREIARLLAARQSFIAETVLANQAYRRTSARAQTQGWFVRLLYVGVPTVEDAIARVAIRVAEGGHDVPEADIRRRWPRTHENLAWFVQHADAVDVFANTWDAHPTLVAHSRAGRVTLLDAAVLPAVTQVLRPLLGPPAGTTG